MANNTLRSLTSVLAMDLLVLALCCLGAYRLSEKAGFPALFEQKGNAMIVCASATPLLISGDTLIAVNGVHIGADEEIEFLCDRYAIGVTIPVTIQRNGEDIFIPVVLVRDYSESKIIIEASASLLFFLIGIAVIILQRKEKDARIFHHLSIAIAALILLSTGRFTISPYGIGFALELLFLCSYVLVPVLFLHFTFIFPNDTLRNKRTILAMAYSLAALLGGWASVSFLRAAYPIIHLEHFAEYNAANYAILIFFAVPFFLGFGILLHSYRAAKDEFERRKLRWIFFGIVFGTGAYLAISVVPKIITGKNANEQYAIALSIIAPISFAIAIVRFKVFDIDLFLKRSTVYTLVIGLLLAMYIGVVAILSEIILAMNLPPSLANMVGAILIAILFDPLRRQIQTVVDKKFFRVSYNFHEAQRDMIERIKFVHTKHALASLLIERLNELIPATKIGFFIVEHPSDRLKLLAQLNFDILERHQIQLRTSDLKSKLELPVALGEKMEQDVIFEQADREMFQRWGIALVLPMLSSERQILGFLVMGEKRSGTRFYLEDISLLTSVTTQAGLTLERLDVGYALMLKQAESERLAELSALKSYFVSSVSHDLKTPLTSIRLFAEIMKEHENLPRQQTVEYLGIIEGESDRLARLITNVLDFATIEKGSKAYTFRDHDLNDIARDAIRSLNYQITSQGFEMHEHISSKPLFIEGDYDAVFDAIANLFSNAMKYSPPKRKCITLSTASLDGFAVLSVQDEGFGIPKHELEHIFESFYRVNESRIKSAGGAGIGLAIVRHTMQAHRGRVEIESEVGKGSIFALYFPLRKP